MINLLSKTDEFIKMIDLLSKTNVFIKMINLFDKTNDFRKHINLLSKTSLGKSGHVRFPTFGKFSHVSDPKMVF